MFTFSINKSIIVPLESKYERGRWNCFDYYDKEPSTHAKPRVVDSAVLQQTVSNQESNRIARKAPHEKLQKGLENSFAPSEIRNLIYSKRPDLLNPSNASGANGTGQASTLAIDSKIEQAMDLVKTHLMFAVREELDVLRGKITELEAHVCSAMRVLVSSFFFFFNSHYCFIRFSIKKIFYGDMKH
ncbi:TSC-22/dip/bun family protein [Dictyocaulus viviparus]|uniref:TSC-22/dip/bun family protein n=1 Tax=Dictyocaulus viviparus TaxID=29172 RepID=A0A0D8X7W4_DICVI|nr:TSC-22/dip/bun family protein [Dictyocaulus viviparus]